MVGYTENHTRETYKFYSQQIKSVIMSRYIKWGEFKTDPTETMKMFRNLNEKDLVLGI